MSQSHPLINGGQRLNSSLLTPSSLHNSTCLFWVLRLTWLHYFLQPGARSLLSNEHAVLMKSLAKEFLNYTFECMPWTADINSSWKGRFVSWLYGCLHTGVCESVQCEAAALSNAKSVWVEALVLETRATAGPRHCPLMGRVVARPASLYDTSLSFP